jgi:hypothetical protein
MAELLEAFVEGRDRLVTSPPTPLSAPPPLTAPPPRLSRPILIQEVVSLPPRGYSAAPRSTSTPSMPAISALKPPRVEARVDPRSEPPEPQVRDVPLDAVLRRTGAPPTVLDHRGAFILGFVDGSSSLEDIIDACGLPSGDVVRIVGELLESGTLQIQ